MLHFFAPLRLCEGTHSELGSTTAQTASTTEEAFVVAHDQLRLNLRDCVHRDANED